MKHTVSIGQDLWDVSIQNFGQIDNIFDVINDNSSIDLNGVLFSQQEITVNSDNKGDLIKKKFFKSNNFKVINSNSFLQGGDFNNDFNNDFN